MTDISKELKKAVLEGTDDLALSKAKEALETGSQPIALINDGLIPGIIEAGELWKKNVYFWPEVVMSTEAFKAAMEVIEPHLSAGEVGTAGKVVIGTVAGDMHNLGKMIVINMLKCANFNVIDLGEDVSMTTFIDKVRELNPDVLGLGCYMTTTMPEMRDVVKSLKKSGLRNNVKVIIGGVPTSQQFAEDIGADAWGKDAFEAVEKVKQLLGELK
jgi:5-methyltetrahydrofolate--homocysteine methyltransferase